MNKIDVVSAKPAESLSQGTTGPSKPKIRAVGGKYADNGGDFDELTVMAWSATTFRPYAAEFFKVKAEDSETRKQLQSIDEWVKAQLTEQGKELTVKNYKEIMKQIDMEQGVRTVDEFLTKVMAPVEEAPAAQKLSKKSAFMAALKNLMTLYEEEK